MKKVSAGLIAAILAIGLSGLRFMEESGRQGNSKEDNKMQTFIYAIFQETSPNGEMDFSNYVLQTTIPPSNFCPGAVRVCWIRLMDRDGDGTITQLDFIIIADELDVDDDGQISDDQTENNVTYEEKA